MRIEDEIRDRLTAVFTPAQLKVVNESHKHQGHAGDDGSGETHFHVAISAEAFGPMSRIARHRAVHAALGPELVGRIHALAMDISAS
ncbi:MAG: BolA family protein [Gemmobacter sp.]|nr:BolA family protein [Gemmobacter sp.]